MFTLSIDCGGSFFKASVLDENGTMHAQEIRIPTPYPITPQVFVKTIADLASKLPAAQRVTVGVPGMIRHGVVIATPHYVCPRGPYTRRDPDLVNAWHGFDAQSKISEKLGIPTLVMNDAEVHGAGIVTGAGLELVLTLGTGLGCALFDGGRLAPHFELSHAPAKTSATYDEWIGESERRRIGTAFWSRRIRVMVENLRPVFLWDRLYIGGGNSRLLTGALQERLGDDVVIVPNSAGILGGVRAWSLRQ